MPDIQSEFEDGRCKLVTFCVSKMKDVQGYFRYNARTKTRYEYDLLNRKTS